ncbi:prenylated rab acceptor family protein [Populus alba x Populus x berolinensis]|nr:prenylated rab acceptor family protein [Populus alba x Populus x berolinensis]
MRDQSKPTILRLLSMQSFAATFSERVTRTVRKFSPHLAAKMRPRHMPVIRGRPSAKKSVYILGQPRLLFVLLFSAVSFVLWYASGSLLYISWALISGLLVVVLHASFKTPNLKARLNTFREEFRAVWLASNGLGMELLYWLHFGDTAMVTPWDQITNWAVVGVIGL